MKSSARVLMVAVLIILWAGLAKAGTVVQRGSLPEIPSFEAVSTNSTSTTLHFSDPNPALHGYYVLVRANVRGGFAAIQWLPSSASTTLINGLAPNTDYCFYLRAHTGLGAAKVYSSIVESCAHTPAGYPHGKPNSWVSKNASSLKAQGLTAYSSIQQAIAAAQPGQIIGVLPGIYNEAVEIGQANAPQSNIKLIAMADLFSEVNPGNDVNNQNWPVVIVPPADRTLDGIRTVASSNILIRGFWVRNGLFNGIHVMGRTSGNSVSGVIKVLCSNVVVEGNRVEGVYEDGIKAHQCTNLRISNNVIKDSSLINFHVIDPKTKKLITEVEQGIDFVAVGNSLVEGNLILAGGTGMTVKGGSINVSLVGNQFVGPFRLINLTAGEPTETGYAFRSSYKNAGQNFFYQTKSLLLMNNIFHKQANSNALSLLGCDDCSLVENQIESNNAGSKKISIVTSSYGASQDICMDAAYDVEKNGVTTSNYRVGACTESFPAAVPFVNSANNSWDMH